MNGKNFMKRVVALLIGIMCLFTTACNNQKETARIESETSAEDIVAVNAGDSSIYLDEAKYYAYTAQATYETYYIAENKEINWDGNTKKGVSMETLVKSTVLDEMCEREFLYGYAGEYNISLTKKEKKEINTKVANYFDRTADALLKKINIKKESLKKIFTKAKIAEKVKEVMNASDEKYADNMYKSWKNENTVTADKQWENINFSEHIFTLEDLAQ
jgi:membrane-bound inhibitor of C-type lysozyme